MIGRLIGRVSYSQGGGHDVDGTVLVDVGGVGYEVYVPLGAAGRAQVDDGGRATLFVHTHVREDALTLFGFPTEADRSAFRTLLGVSNVGPKTALAVLSAFPSGDLARVVATKDLKALTQVPGIGKKTAELMLLQLRDKELPRDGAAGASVPANGGDLGVPPPKGRQVELLASALMGLGYRTADAERAATTLRDRGGAALEDRPMPELLREALALLAK